jgi:hypothetical protein
MQCAGTGRGDKQLVGFRSDVLFRFARQGRPNYDAIPGSLLRQGAGIIMSEWEIEICSIRGIRQVCVGQGIGEYLPESPPDWMPT